MDEAMMMIMADNRDDFAVSRSNNWLAWLTVTSTSRVREGGRAPQLIMNQLNQNTPKAATLGALIRSWINIDPGSASTQKSPKLFIITKISHKHWQLPIETFNCSRKPTTAKRTLTNQNLRTFNPVHTKSFKTTTVIQSEHTKQY